MWIILIILSHDFFLFLEKIALTFSTQIDLETYLNLIAGKLCCSCDGIMSEHVVSFSVLDGSYYISESGADSNVGTCAMEEQMWLRDRMNN